MSPTLIASFVGEENMIAEVHTRRDGKFGAGLRDGDLEEGSRHFGQLMGVMAYASKDDAIAYAKKLVGGVDGPLKLVIV